MYSLINCVWPLICGLGMALLRAFPSEIPLSRDDGWTLKSLKMLLMDLSLWINNMCLYSSLAVYDLMVMIRMVPHRGSKFSLSRLAQSLL